MASDSVRVMSTSSAFSNLHMISFSVWSGWLGYPGAGRIPCVATSYHHHCRHHYHHHHIHHHNHHQHHPVTMQSEIQWYVGFSQKTRVDISSSSSLASTPPSTSSSSLNCCDVWGLGNIKNNNCGDATTTIFNMN